MKLLIFMAVFLMMPRLHAAPEPIIYGTITTHNGETFSGSIFWGKQETFLSDIFNAEKISTVGIEHLSEQQREELEDHQPGPQANFGNIQITFKSIFGKGIKPPEFSVYFGAIKHIEINQGVFVISLHDGTTITSQDNANDLRATLQIKSPEGEERSFDLDELKKVTFNPAPNNAKTWGDGIYGTLSTDLGHFQGRIMWDKDERLGFEELDGQQNQKEYAIKFADILSIEKNNKASTVVLRDGKTLTLTGTNDVNMSNRGIWLDHPDLGRVEINWQQFQKLVIEPVEVNWLTFHDYANNTRPLAGTVTLKNGQKIKADQMAFDLNQQSNAELITIKSNNHQRQIPLRLIKKMVIINDLSTTLSLHDGSTLQAYGSHSVNHDNNGILITSNNQHQWLKWKDIQTIEFD